MTEINSTSARTVLLVLNPKAGRGAKSYAAEQLASALERRNLDHLQVTSLDQLAEMTAGPSAAAIRAVVALGGDGTAAAVANAANAEVPIAPYPLGTENLLAKYLKMPADPERVAAAIDGDRRLTLDVGRVNGRKFLLMFSCGFDAEVVDRLDSHRTGPISRLSYTKPIWQALRNYQFPNMAVSIWQNEDDEPTVLQGQWLFAFNLPCYARGLPIAPEANAQDGELNLRLFKSQNALSGIFHFATVAAGIHGKWSGCERHTAIRMRVESEAPIPFQVDGDAGGHLPAEIDIIPDGVHLVLP